MTIQNCTFLYFSFYIFRFCCDHWCTNFWPLCAIIQNSFCIKRSKWTSLTTPDGVWSKNIKYPKCPVNTLLLTVCDWISNLAQGYWVRTIVLVLECVPDVDRWVITATQQVTSWEWQTTGGESWSVVWGMVSCYVLIWTYVKHASSLVLRPCCECIARWMELQIT